MAQSATKSIDRPRPAASPIAGRPRSGGPHVLAWVLACATFPLIWMGGFVTTYEAGMAVPDWPNTYGYNLFLYPLDSWLQVWDIFLEHSHRLVASGVGMITIALAVALWRLDGRRWMRWLGVIAVGAVSFQGLLGGLRVVGDERVLANVHGCIAPLFFALCGAMVAFTSWRWMEPGQPMAHPGARSLWRWTLAGVVAVYVQIVFGAQLRHIPHWISPGLYQLWVWAHLLMLVVIATIVVWLLRRTRRFDERGLRRRAWMFGGLFLVQLSLGVATWVTNYSWPKWFQTYVWPLGYTVKSEGAWQAVATTAHVAVGSLLLVAALALALWSRRLTRPEAVSR